MSDGIDFSRISRKHVVAACRVVLSSGAPPRRAGRSTFLVFEDHHLPAKYVLGLAYEMATGINLEPDEFTGGEATARVLRGLGFRVDGPTRSSPTRGPARPARTKAAKSVPLPATIATTGKVGLRAALKSRFGRVETEVTFPWLVVPKPDQRSPEIEKLRDVLKSHRGFAAFDTPGHQLRCDFYLPEKNAIIEVDERQHYTKPRAMALRNYPPTVALGFDKTRWIKDCERIAATDPSPPHRDEQRAYYDSLRDLLAGEHGVRLIRVADAELGTQEDVARTLSAIAEALGENTVDFTIATACIAGTTAKSAAENRCRIALLGRIVEEIQARQWFPTVLLLPGGYFRLPCHIGPKKHADRVQRLEGQAFAKACRIAAGHLGGTVIVGVDSIPWHRPGFQFPDAGDQLCVAWDKSSLVGLGRKVFPTNGEADDLVIYANDMRARSRLATLHDHRQALLCSCYDMFGCSERAGSPGVRSKNIRWLQTEQDGLLERRSQRAQVAAAIATGVRAWEALVSAAIVGCVAIHGFTRTGPGSGKAYWQRHGVEKASRFLGGRLAFGAAHLEPPLPSPTVATFAARNGRRILPDDHFTVSVSDGLAALVRLYRP